MAVIVIISSDKGALIIVVMVLILRLVVGAAVNTIAVTNFDNELPYQLHISIELFL